MDVNAKSRVTAFGNQPIGHSSGVVLSEAVRVIESVSCVPGSQRKIFCFWI